MIAQGGAVLSRQPIRTRRMVTAIGIRLTHLGNRVSSLRRTRGVQGTTDCTINDGGDTRRRDTRIIISLRDHLTRTSSAFDQILRRQSRAVGTRGDHQSRFDTAGRVLPHARRRLPYSPLSTFLRYRPPRPNDNVSTVLQILRASA